MSVSDANTASPLPPLPNFSPSIGPKDIVFQCPFKDQPVKPATVRPKKPCDVLNLKVQIAEPGATDKAEETLVFETIKAAGAAPSRRPRDLPITDKVPDPIRSQLATYDLVIEVIAPTSDAGVGSAKVPGAKVDAEHEKRMALAKAKTSGSSTTTLHVASSWSAHCGDLAHSASSLQIDDKPVELKGATFALPIKSKSKASLKNIWKFVTSGLNPKVLGNPYVIGAGSCGVTTKGPATTNLSALVTAFPSGTTGIKLAFEGFSFGFGWTSADKYSDKYMKSQEDYLENTDEKAIEARITAIQANNARLERKRPTGGKKITGHKVKLHSARQELTEMQHRLEAKEEMETSPFSLNIVLFDEEIEAGEVYETVKKAITNLRRAQRTLEGLTNALSFLRTYSPSVVAPIAKIDITLSQVELFIGFKLSSDEHYKGARWRALPRCFDIEMNAKALEISGSLGAVIGKRVVGTGATIEIMFSPTASISLGAEYSSPNIFTDELASWRDTKLKMQGSFAGTSSLLGKVTVLYCNLAHVSVSGNCSGRLSTENKLADIMAENPKWTWTLTLDPIGGIVEAYLIGWCDPWKYPFEISHGGAWDL